MALSRIYQRAEAGRACFYLRDMVFVSKPDGAERDVEQWADFQIKNHDFSRDERRHAICATNIPPSAG